MSNNNFDYDTVLNKLATAIHDDFEWGMKTELIFENDGQITDPATLGFLKGVYFCTTKYLDILESEQPVREDRNDGICLCDMNIVGGNENE